MRKDLGDDAKLTGHLCSQSLVEQQQLTRLHREKTDLSISAVLITFELFGFFQGSNTSFLIYGYFNNSFIIKIKARIRLGVAHDL